jgi:hypothetical protein
VSVVADVEIVQCGQVTQKALELRTADPPLPAELLPEYI